MWKGDLLREAWIPELFFVYYTHKQKLRLHAKNHY